MKRKIILLIFLIWIVVGKGYSDIMILNSKYYNDNDLYLQIINDINYFRGLTIFEKLKLLNISLKNFLNNYINNSDYIFLPELTIKKDLMGYALTRFKDIFNEKKINHKYMKSNKYVLTGESIYIIAFENYIDLEKVVKIFEEKIFKDSIMERKGESYFLNFPYNSIGIALGLARIYFDKEEYNVYILVIEYGLTKLNYYNEFVGRIYIGNKICNKCKFKLKINNNNFLNLITNSDGTFYSILPIFDNRCVNIYFFNKTKKICFPQKKYLIKFD